MIRYAQVSSCRNAGCLVFISNAIQNTLLKTNVSPGILPSQKEAGSSSNHHFSGVNSLSNFWGEYIVLSFLVHCSVYTNVFRYQTNPTSRKENLS